MDVALVLAAGAHGAAGAEHQDGEFRVDDAVDDTGELLGFVLAIQLDGDVREIQFLGHSGRGNHVHDGEAFFITAHKAPAPAGHI